MTILRAHFDGRVIVPDEPVDLPQGRTLEVRVTEADAISAPAKPRTIADLPTFSVPPDAAKFGLKDVKRAEDEPY